MTTTPEVRLMRCASRGLLVRVHPYRLEKTHCLQESRGEAQRPAGRDSRGSAAAPCGGRSGAPLWGSAGPGRSPKAPSPPAVSPPTLHLPHWGNWYLKCCLAFPALSQRSVWVFLPRMPSALSTSTSPEEAALGTFQTP